MEDLGLLMDFVDSLELDLEPGFDWGQVNLVEVKQQWH